MWQALEKIPGIKLVAFPETVNCCGAGGSYLLTHHEQALQIRDDSLNAILDLKPDILVTSNVGCALHLKDGVDVKDMNVEVLHPLQLLDRHLQKEIQ